MSSAPEQHVRPGCGATGRSAARRTVARGAALLLATANWRPGWPCWSSAAVVAGDPVMAVLEDATGQRLRTELGPARRDGVQFLDPAAVHTVPGFTTAVRWAGSIGRVTRPGGPGVDRRRSSCSTCPDADPSYWTRLCSGSKWPASGCR